MLFFATLTLGLLQVAVLAEPSPIGQLEKRQEGPDAVTTGDANSSTSSATESQPTQIYTGVFTVPGMNGVYDVTSVSGYIQVAGYSLTADGPDALVGGVRVTVASGGSLVADGETVQLQQYTPSSTTAEQITSMASTATLGTAAGSEATSSAPTSSAGANVNKVGVIQVAVWGGLGALLL